MTWLFGLLLLLYLSPRSEYKFVFFLFTGILCFFFLLRDPLHPSDVHPHVALTGRKKTTIFVFQPLNINSSKCGRECDESSTDETILTAKATRFI